MLRFVTAGESHGKELIVILEGVPAGLKIKAEDINKDLARRQLGFGRGARMKIEEDAVEFISGVRLGETIGSPICLAIKNYDWKNWERIMSAEEIELGENTIQSRPRPGHADLAAAIKYDRKDLRDILERASARETAARVACGAVCKKFLSQFGATIYSFTNEIAGIKAQIEGLSKDEIISRTEKSPVRTPDHKAEKEMMETISAAQEKGDTVGGTFTVVAAGLVPGLGSHTQWDQKLDAKLAMSLMSIQAIKGVQFGLGFGFSSILGSHAHDEILYSKKTGFFRKTNNAGGFEGGTTNGENIVVNCVMKPIPSLKKPLSSVNIKTKQVEAAEAVRSDVCAVPSAGVIGEAAAAFALTEAFKEKFGGDSMKETKNNYDSYIKQVKEF
jgi:chorismate synthase